MTTIALPKVHWAVWATPLAIALAGAAVHGIMMLVPPPADLDLSRTRTSDLGSFAATIEPGPIAVGETQTWTIEVRMADGSPVAPEAITVDGGMPLHGHGLPTVPEVTRD